MANWVQVNATGGRVRRQQPASGAGGDDLNGAGLPRGRLHAEGAGGDGQLRRPRPGQGRPDRPLRLRRRRQLRRAGRLHRPLRHRPRGRGRGGGGGAQGGDAIWSHRWYANFNQTRRARPAASWAATTCPAPTCGSATTPSSPRTAAWASSPTSSATTSACPTCTTPPAGRERHRLLVPDELRLVGLRYPATPSATSRCTWARGRSWSLGWLGDTLAQVALGRRHHLRPGSGRDATKGRSQALRVNLPDHHQDHPGLPGRRRRSQLLLLRPGATTWTTP